MGMKAGVDVFDELGGGPEPQPTATIPEDPLSIPALYDRWVAESSPNDPNGRLLALVGLAIAARLEFMITGARHDL